MPIVQSRFSFKHLVQVDAFVAIAVGDWLAWVSLAGLSNFYSGVVGMLSSSTPSHSEPLPVAPIPIGTLPIAPATETLSARIDSLRREDETLYNILAVDVWALAKTMDEFQPGFWSEFMKNRERALRRFMSEVVVKSKPTTAPRRPPFLR
jgi:hypothetical protein